MNCPNCKAEVTSYQGFFSRELQRMVDWCKLCDSGTRAPLGAMTDPQVLYDGKEKIVISPAYRREIEHRYVYPDGDVKPAGRRIIGVK